MFAEFRSPQAPSTDVPPSSLCPPRRRSGAGVGVGMLKGARDSLKLLFYRLSSFYVHVHSHVCICLFCCHLVGAGVGVGMLRGAGDSFT